MRIGYVDYFYLSGGKERIPAAERTGKSPALLTESETLALITSCRDNNRRVLSEILNPGWQIHLVLPQVHHRPQIEAGLAEPFNASADPIRMTDGEDSYTHFPSSNCRDKRYARGPTWCAHSLFRASTAASAQSPFCMADSIL